MTERTNITNLVLLTILAGFLLLSGGLQCAFDCLQPIEFSYNTAFRVDTCHQTNSQPELAASCINKACHQGSQPLRDLDGPEIHQKQTDGLPMLSNSQPTTADQRVGNQENPPRFEQIPAPPQLLTSSLQPLQTYQAIRATVLLM